MWVGIPEVWEDPEAYGGFSVHTSGLQAVKISVVSG